MSTTATYLAGFWGFLAVLWLYRHHLFNKFYRFEKLLSTDYPDAPESSGQVTVLIAGRDEEDNIERCLSSLLVQNYPNLQVVFVDDRSRDQTVQRAKAIIDSDERAMLVQVDELPPGWLGKNHALDTGMQHATGDWLLFVDADCAQLSERSINIAVGYALQHKADLLSVMPNLDSQSFWEKVVQPVCAGVLGYWIPPEAANTAEKPEQAYANGAFMLFRREAYEAIGGHRAVKGHVMEDMDLAKLIVANALKLRVIANDPDSGIYNVRMYASFSEMLRGWTRIFWGGFRPPWRMAVTAIGLLTEVAAVFVALGAGVMWLAGVQGGWGVVAAAAFAATFVQMSISWRMLNYLRIERWLALAWPLGCLVVVWILLKSALLYLPGASLNWRDTVYRVSEID